MKGSVALAALLSTTAARFIDSSHRQLPPSQQIVPDQVSLTPQAEPELYTIEIAEGRRLQVTEEEKWQLRRDGIRFFDVSDHLETFSAKKPAKKVTYPNCTSQQETVVPLLQSLSKDAMKANLEKFSGFYTRYYKSSYGAESSAWLLSKVQDTINESGSKVASVEAFPHSWGQSSLIASIPGKSNKTIVIGAHQDSINLFFPSALPAPGADDDGSGTVTILEAFRVLLTDPTIANGSAPNTLEFHWYSAEEGGLLGSQAIFAQYQNTRDVKAMLQQDMTGYNQGSLRHGEDVLAVIQDWVDPALTVFVQRIVESYNNIKWVPTRCGYACSDHASASKAGFQSAFVIESTFDESNKNIHGTGDTVDKLDFNHMREHAILTTAFAVELAHADL